MSLTKKEQNAALAVESAASTLAAQINEFSKKLEALTGAMEDQRTAYALGLALIKSTGMKAAVETLESGIKAKLTAMERVTLNSEPVVLDVLRVPAYTFTPKPGKKIEILDKKPASFLHILKVVVENEAPEAVHKRLNAGEFTPKMLGACAGLVNVTATEDWSVTKRKD